MSSTLNEIEVGFEENHQITGTYDIPVPGEVFPVLQDFMFDNKGNDEQTLAKWKKLGSNTPTLQVGMKLFRLALAMAEQLSIIIILKQRIPILPDENVYIEAFEKDSKNKVSFDLLRGWYNMLESTKEESNDILLRKTECLKDMMDVDIALSVFTSAVPSHSN